MSDFRSWVHAARPRTLALSLACITMGGVLAMINNAFDVRLFVLCITTTVLLQILSNFANDYGDFSSGVDVSGRIGPQRALQSGSISKKEMKLAIGITAALSLASGIILLVLSSLSGYSFLFLLITGLLAIWAAITYTVGKKPYGYRGLGDISVLIFFGLVAVLGSNYIIQGSFIWENIFPAISCGLLAVGVLNLNNMRDLEADKKHGKKTVPVKIGLSAAKQYHFLLILSAWIFILLYSWYHFVHIVQFSFIICMPLFVVHYRKVLGRSGKELDPLLKHLSLSTLFFVLLFGISWILVFKIT